MLYGCYYYGWYEGFWLHNTKKLNPILGEYNNKVYSSVLDDQFKLAKDSGIDFFSISWDHRQNHYHLIDAAERTGIKVTFFYESMTRNIDGVIPDSNLDLVLKDMESIKEYMDSSCWLEINNKKVIMLYVTRVYRGDLVKIFSGIRNLFDNNIFIVADQLFWDDLPDDTVKLFDAVTGYNMYQPGRFIESIELASSSYLESAQKQMLKYKEICVKNNIELWGNAMPGYDDSGVRPQENHYPIPRNNGEFFKHSLRNALDVTTGQAMMITSFNEWYEDTQIEPTKEYGNLYLDILKASK